MKTRTFLFLQGPASPFFGVLADRLEKKGAGIRRINFCLGDALFWRRKEGRFFRGRKEDWPDYLAAFMREEAVTDIVMLGDGRDYHAAAVEKAYAADIRVHIIEHGYLRPDWLTVEPDGMSAHSRFPQDPDAIRALAGDGPQPADGRLYTSSFLTYALYDLAYHIPNVVLGPFVHPHYRTHGAVHPAIEYSGWILKALTRRRRRKKAAEAIAAATFASDGLHARFFLFPLQLPGDYQIRRHSPGGDLFNIVSAVIRSFAVSAPRDSHLLFKIHPIDNGLSQWPRRIGEDAARLGIADRVHVADGGDTDELIAGSAGVVTVNSTVGLTALGLGKPVIALGAAIYDVAGLTSQGTLGDFWNEPPAPDPALFDAFKRALAATTQVRGGFIGADALRAGADNIAERLMEEDQRLPLGLRRPRNTGLFRYSSELGLF